MKQKALLFFTDIDLTLIGFFCFFSVFIGACLWVYRKGSTETYSYIESLPLDEGEQGGR